MRALLLGIGMLLMSGCELYGVFPWQVRVPIEDVGAQFVIADATWFEDEETLFIFYQVEANQGLSANSQFELAYRTDEVTQEFAPLETLPTVHRHVPANCGVHTLCGSFSTPVARLPRNIQLRLRYHRDGELTLSAPMDVHTVASGLPHDSRSAVVYGVFNRNNLNVQWRLRHQFPAIRNHEAESLGLRREFRIEESSTGTFPNVRAQLLANPYGYALANTCPNGFVPHVTSALETHARAMFDFSEVSIESSPSPHVCAISIVKDALGEFSTTALAQKNPETKEAFPELQTPITENTRVQLFLETCNDRTSALHRAMQMQRLSLTEADVVCIDDHNTMDFPARLATLMSERIDIARERGDDMVLVLGLNRPRTSAAALHVEQALALMVPFENAQSTPRLSGVFVFDTAGYIIQDPAVARLTLWCPSSFNANDLGAIPDTSARDCAVQTPMPLALGELELSSLPILPTERQYENFIEDYGPAQTGRMTEITYHAPTRTPTSDNVPVGDFAVATFFNNEAITPAPFDAFSYCAEEDTGLVVFRIEGFADIIPLSFLGEVHTLLMLNRYELGLFWDFPFLMDMKYESTLAAAVDANIPDEIPLVLAIGISTPEEQFLGGFQWQQDSFEVGRALLQCTRFCDHPTFDSSRVYNVDDLFFDSYAARCYRPNFPIVGDDGFPLDP